MSIAFARSSGPYPVCSQARERLAAFPVLGAGREERAEGKIKETGTTGRRFLGKPLSAHCFGVPFPAPCFSSPRAACSRKALALLGFDRHHSPKSGGLRHFGLEARP